jgi:hypothetical protein
MKLTDVIKNSVEARGSDTWPTYDGAMLDRSKFVTASEIGKCARQIYFSKYAARYSIPPARGKGGWGYFARGHNVEAWAVEQMRASKEDVRFEYIGKDQVSFYADVQSGTPDGIMFYDNEVIVLDIKSIDPRKNTKILPDTVHLDQVQQNMDLVAYCLDYEVTGGLLLYINASNYELMHEHEFKPNYPRMRELEARSKMIMAATAAENIRAEGIFNGGCKFCTFTEHCNAAQERQKELSKQEKQQQAIAKNIF